MKDDEKPHRGAGIFRRAAGQYLYKPQTPNPLVALSQACERSATDEEDRPICAKVEREDIGMKSSTFRSILILCFLAVLPLLAADFWEKKAYTSWSEKECNKLLKKSPWAFSNSLMSVFATVWVCHSHRRYSTGSASSALPVVTCFSESSLWRLKKNGVFICWGRQKNPMPAHA